MFPNLKSFKVINNSSQNSITKYFIEYFNDEKISNIIISNIKIFIKNLIQKHFNKLKLIYIAIDGVPNKAKIVEQKKRRYIGIFSSFIHKLILKNNTKYLKNNNYKI